MAHHGLEGDSVGQGRKRDPGVQSQTLRHPSAESIAWAGSKEPLQILSAPFTPLSLGPTASLTQFIPQALENLGKCILRSWGQPWGALSRDGGPLSFNPAVPSTLPPFSNARVRSSPNKFLLVCICIPKFLNRMTNTTYSH